MSHRSQKAATRIEQVAASMNSGALVDFLQMQVNSVGTATAMFAETGDPVSLDVILENNQAIETIVKALQARKKDSPYSPAPDAHLEKLKDIYLSRRASSVASSAQIPDEVRIPL